MAFGGAGLLVLLLALLLGGGAGPARAQPVPPAPLPPAPAVAAAPRAPMAPGSLAAPAAAAFAADPAFDADGHAACQATGVWPEEAAAPPLGRAAAKPTSARAPMGHEIVAAVKARAAAAARAPAPQPPAPLAPGPPAPVPEARKWKPSPLCPDFMEQHPKMPRCDPCHGFSNVFAQRDGDVELTFAKTKVNAHNGQKCGPRDAKNKYTGFTHTDLQYQMGSGLDKHEMYYDPTKIRMAKKHKQLCLKTQAPYATTEEGVHQAAGAPLDKNVLLGVLDPVGGTELLTELVELCNIQELPPAKYNDQYGGLIFSSNGGDGTSQLRYLKVGLQYPKGGATPEAFISYAFPEAAGPGPGGPLGCYADSADDRLLDGPTMKSGGMTPEMCKDFCADEGDFPAYGVEFGKECYCGALPPASAKIDEAACDVPCGGDTTQTCGGADAINVFEVSSSSGTSGKVLTTASASKPLGGLKYKDPKSCVTFKLVYNVPETTATGFFKAPGDKKFKTIGTIDGINGEFRSVDQAGMQQAIGSTCFAGVMGSSPKGGPKATFCFDRFSVKQKNDITGGDGPVFEPPPPAVPEGPVEQVGECPTPGFGTEVGCSASAAPTANEWIAKESDTLPTIGGLSQAPTDLVVFGHKAYITSANGAFLIAPLDHTGDLELGSKCGSGPWPSLKAYHAATADCYQSFMIDACPSEASYEEWADGDLQFLPLGIDIDRKSDPANPHIYILGSANAPGGIYKGGDNTGCLVQYKLAQKNSGAWDWLQTNKVSGLPRALANHGPNDVEVVTNIPGYEGKDVVCMALGGNTGGGSPTEVTADEFKDRPESVLSASIVCADVLERENPAWDHDKHGKCDINPIGGMCGGTGGGGGMCPPKLFKELAEDLEKATAKHSVPIPCMEPAKCKAGAGAFRLGVPASKSDDLLCAHKSAAYKDLTSCHVEIYSSGFRNAYGFTQTRDGHLIAANNGHSGDAQMPDSPTDCEMFYTEDLEEMSTNKPAWGNDNLAILGQGCYLGHPAPARDECVWFDGEKQDDLHGGTWEPHPHYRADRVFLVGDHLSVCGVMEYSDDLFCGQLDSKLLTVHFAKGDNVAAYPILRGPEYADGIALDDDPFTVVGGLADPIQLGPIDKKAGTFMVAEFDGSVNKAGSMSVHVPALGGKTPNYSTANSVAPQLKVATDGAASAVFAGKLYLFGGKTGGKDTPTAEVLEFTPGAAGLKAWGAVPNHSSTGFYGATAVAHEPVKGAAVFVLCGGQKSPKKYIGKCTVVNAETGAAKKTVKLPGPPRAKMGVEVVYDKWMVLVGGEDVNGAATTVSVMDLETQTFAKGPFAKLPGTGRIAPATMALNDQLYAIGGATDGGTVASMLRFDLATNAWESTFVGGGALPALPGNAGKSGAQTSKMQGRLMTCFGLTSKTKVSNKCYRLDPWEDDPEWEDVDATADVIGVADAGFGTIGGTLYGFGGTNGVKKQKQGFASSYCLGYKGLKCCE